MPKLFTSIARPYRPGWGLIEGAREAIQNGLDAEIELNAKLTVDYVDGKVRITNEGATLEREAILVGHSTKRGRSDLIGVHGDGFPSGALAIVRDGYSLKIRNGGEVWTASIEHSDAYKADVLTFDIAIGRKETPRVRVEIGGVAPDQWAEIRERFLALDGGRGERVKTDDGELLMGDFYKGRVYVKGIFVETDRELAYGYNFSTASVDIERKMVDSYDKRSAMRRIWHDAVARRPDLVTPMLVMLDKQTADVAGVNEYNAYEAKTALVDAAAADFVQKFGSDAIACKSLAETTEAAHLGKRGIVVPDAMRAILARSNVVNFDKAKAALSRETLCDYGWEDLTVIERDHLTEAVEMVSAARPTVTLDLVDVCDFRKPGTMGLFASSRIKLARKGLTTREEVLSTLVHEAAHYTTGAGDGDKSHVAEIESIWTAIVKKLAGW